MDEIDLHTWIIAIGEARGREFDFATMGWKDPPPLSLEE